MKDVIDDLLSCDFPTRGTKLDFPVLLPNLFKERHQRGLVDPLIEGSGQLPTTMECYAILLSRNIELINRYSIGYTGNGLKA
jgi:hypothetical protein